MDGGDCINFNLFYPACKEVKDFEKIDSARIGDGICDRHPYNAAECLFDGGDCRIDAPYCSSSKKGTLGDNICDEELNIWECYFDRGDCLDSGSFSDVGNGICSLDYIELLDFKYYDIGDPSYDGGDCIHPGYKGCTFTSSHLNFVDEIGDEKCHNTWFHNKEECGWDGGDCVEFNKKYPHCKDSDLFLYSMKTQIRMMIILQITNGSQRITPKLKRGDLAMVYVILLLTQLNVDLMKGIVVLMQKKMTIAI